MTDLGMSRHVFSGAGAGAGVGSYSWTHTCKPSTQLEVKTTTLYNASPYRPKEEEETMVLITLPQGTYKGATKDTINIYHGIPYSQPFERFQSPKPITPNPSPNPTSDANTIHDATTWGPICPQNPSALQPHIYGPWPSPPKGGEPDESLCGVVSVYQPEEAAGAKEGSGKLPVIVYIHGGAWQTGSSQIDWYTGTALAQDGNCIVVALSYRMGVLGFMYESGKPLACGNQDHILALEWVKGNIGFFGGDVNNITAAGQSAGAYNTQLLLDVRPDLFKRAIIMSSPAGMVFKPEDAEKVAQLVRANLPEGKTTTTASVSELLKAQGVASGQVGGLAQFAPVVADGVAPGGRVTVESEADRKDVWVTWLQHDGSAFAAIAGGHGTKAEDALSVKLTDDVFKKPSIELAQRLAKAGHKVATLEHQWSPKGFLLGATHCLDLPVILGDAEAWKESPLRGTESAQGWDRRGRMIRQAFGQFAHSGKVPEVLEGAEVRVVS
ncbi:hypothetical protein LTR62_004464 [Meristemomyces frigidus]|uniref:Carboxylesterase type B domain-containing protein n=1 Tax=Meristemomyces frigidus TaxID=1508187 RepID=A0AAN7THA0_9PEZI|nr:hypothetical protein LTR62_004464 [Meristemomyces frigidus]